MNRAPAAILSVSLLLLAAAPSLGAPGRATPAPAAPAPVPAAAARFADLARIGTPGMAAIQGPAMSAHIRFLADDLLEGRAPGTPGHSLAALYLATQLQALGVEPMGENGTWIQKVPLLAVRTDPSGCELRIGTAPSDWTLADGEEVLVYPSPSLEKSDVSGPLVFAGHGIVAPMYKYDDTPKDVRGKIVVVLGRAPRSERDDFFPPAPSAIFGDLRRKMRMLARRGAVAVIAVSPPESLASYPWAERARDRKAFEEMFWMEGDRPGGGPRLPRAEVSPAAFDKLLRLAGRKETMAKLLELSKSGGLKPFDLGLTATLRSAGTSRRMTAENVVGVLRGSDPARASEYVVVSAHLDHLGVGPAVAGDTIYNGAVDDAAGVASLIEMARGFTALGKRPPRSILFLGVTAEEKGLIGSDYFAHHPTVPVESIVADVNSDAPFGRWRPYDVNAIGAEHSTLGLNARAAAEALGLGYGPDPDPAQVYFIRGDHASFVRVGIPAVQPGIGYRDATGDDKKNRAISDAWLDTKYHQPSDEWDPSLDYENMAIETRYYFLLALSVALDPARPAWNPGDVFESLFPRGSAEE